MISVQEIVSVTGAVPLSLGTETFSGITTDSRSVKEGELFIALCGEKFDGHDYCLTAFAKGAAGILISKNVSDFPVGKTVLQVDDTLKAFQMIAKAHRKYFDRLKIFAVTGSNGKTSTKDLLAACLGAKYNVQKTEGNFNNEIGLPKTLLKIQEDTDIAVVEMGMRGLGQIAELCQIAEPDSGIITNVGEAHIEILGSIDNIAKAKSELTEALPKNGFAVLNGDDARTRAAAAKTVAQRVFFGLGEDCDYRGSNIVSSGFDISFVCTEKSSGKSVKVCLQLIGEHNVYNALAAIAGAACYGVTLEESAAALATARLTGSRQEIIYIGDLTFINDSYNASPASMEAALKTLAEAKKISKGRTIAVLSDMQELGEYSAAAHRRVGALAAEYGVDYVLTYGSEAALISETAAAKGVSVCHCSDRQEASDKLRALVSAGDVILLKGSHAMQVGKLLEIFK